MRTAQIFLKYVDWIGQGDTTRREAAHEFEVSKSTATYHLERAVGEGYLERYYSWQDGNQTGWAYRPAGSNFAIEGEAEIEKSEAEYERELNRQDAQWLRENASPETPTL